MASVSDAQLFDEQAALRRVATLVASGVAETEVVSAVASEIGRLLDADVASVIRWDGEMLQVLGDWFSEERSLERGRIYVFGGDTISARMIDGSGPARIDSVDDLQSEFARDRWTELGIGASLGAPILVAGAVWGVVAVLRNAAREPFAPAAEHRLGDFAGLVAQAIANAEARREIAALIEEQSALRGIATLVAGGRPPHEVLAEVTAQVERLFDAHAVHLVEPEDELEEAASAIGAPVIVNGTLHGTLSAFRTPHDPFPPGAETRLQSFADLVAQSISNHLVQEELRASRARIVQAGDAARQRLERNLHDGAQQRLVSVSISLRVALARLADDPEQVRVLLGAAAEELTHALQELRDLARGLHPAILSEHGLKPALEALARRAQLPVTVANHVEERLPAPVEAAAYYVVAESLTNVARYARANSVTVTVRCSDGLARVEVLDDGRGGAQIAGGSGLRGLVDRVEALGGRFELDSPPGSGTTVRATIPVG